MIEPLALPDIAEDAPAGPDLEYDPAFLAMKLAAVGSAESQFGDSVDGVTPPDWKEVVAQATDLLGRTRDLRVLVQLAVARVNMADLAGFAAALATIRQVVEALWPQLHPLLDPEEPEDTQVRSNALLDLTDGRRLLRPLRDIPLATPPRGKRPVAWRDIAVATGAMEPEPNRDKMSLADISGAFGETEPARLQATIEALDTIGAELAGISQAFDARAGVGQAPDFDPLPKLIRDMKAEVARHEGAVATEPPADAQESGAADEDAPADGPAPARPAGRRFASIRALTALESRDDALYALTLASAYFRDHEPSSPLPLLIDRATRLSAMPFLEILRDLAPDGLQQAQMVAGTPPED